MEDDRMSWEKAIEEALKEFKNDLDKLREHDLQTNTKDRSTPDSKHREKN